MSLAIPNTTATASYVQWGGGSIYAQGGFLFVGNGPVDVVIQKGNNTGLVFDEGPFTLSAGTYPLAAASADGIGIVGLQVRAMGGVLSSPAQQYFGGLFDTGPAIEAGTPFTGTISAGGTIQPGVSQVKVAKDGVLIGTEPEINFVSGLNAPLTVADDSAAGRVNVTVAAAVPLYSVDTSGGQVQNTADNTWQNVTSVQGVVPAAAGTYLCWFGVGTIDVTNSGNSMTFGVSLNGATPGYPRLERLIASDGGTPDLVPGGAAIVPVTVSNPGVDTITLQMFSPAHASVSAGGPWLLVQRVA